MRNVNHQTNIKGDIGGLDDTQEEVPSKISTTKEATLEKATTMRAASQEQTNAEGDTCGTDTRSRIQITKEMEEKDYDVNIGNLSSNQHHIYGIDDERQEELSECDLFPH